MKRRIRQFALALLVLSSSTFVPGTPPSGGDGTQLDFSQAENSGHIVTAGL